MVGIYLYSQKSIFLNSYLAISNKKLISQLYYAPIFVPLQYFWSHLWLQNPTSPQGYRNTLQNRAGKKVSEIEQAMSTLWCLSGIVSHKDFSKTFSYLFCDINLQNCSGTEGRGASVFGLDHQWPYAVFIVCDVVDDVQRSDIGFQLDFPSALVNVKHIGWICLHDGIIHNVVGLFCILVYSLVGEV